LIPKRLGATRILPTATSQPAACQVQAPVTLTERLGDSRKHNHSTGITYSSKAVQLGICFGGEKDEIKIQYAKRDELRRRTSRHSPGF